MAIKAVTRYQSEDGKLHDDIVEARSYDSVQRALTGVKAAILTASPNHMLGNLPLDLVNNPKHAELLRDALNAVLNSHRHYGKLRKNKPAQTATKV
jgi:hypothetical protein